MPDSPIPYPLDPVVVSGTQITVDQYINDPAVITRSIATLAAQRFYMDKVFRPGPAVTGGAILFERPNPLLTDLYAGRRTQEMAPGTQFPVQRFVRGVPMVATPRKIGEKMLLTKEERKRNRVDLIDEAMLQAANTLRRDVEIMGLSELTAVVAATSRTTPAAATWATYVSTTYNNTTHASEPLSDLIATNALVETEERGHQLDSMIINPLAYANLVRYYGASGVAAALASAGFSNVFVTNRQAADKIKLFEAGRVGVWSNEFPLEGNSWFEENTDNTWNYSWSISPTFAVTDPYAVIELTGVA